jgi:hypothetical protein
LFRGNLVKDKKMNKKIVFSIVMLFAATSLFPIASSAAITPTYADEIIQINVEKNNDITTISYHISSYDTEEIFIDDTSYQKIILGDESNFYKTGIPDLPNIRRSLLVPDTQKMKAEVTYSDYIEYQNVLVAPSKGDILRSVDPKTVPYTFGPEYNQNQWFPNTIIELEQPYIIREFRGQIIQINPFQYNPITKTLRFYTDITVEIFSIGEDTTNCIYRESLPESIDADFKAIYQRHFINQHTVFDNRYTPVSEQGNMLVIVYDDFWNTMIPFVEWKNMKGIPTEMIQVSTLGDAAAIRTYIEQYYNTNGLTFVLLVGDAAQMPTLYTSPYTYGASDPSYSFIVGNDNYQDLFIGRFSAQNVNDLETQVERSIEYEKYPQAGAEWYHKGTGIASNQGPGDDGEYDDEHMDNIRDDLLLYTYTIVDQIYDPTATSSMVTNALNDGRSIVNYCGHGSPTSWGSSGFNTGHINQLVNDNMLPFICCVACNNGEFDNYNACFAEAWMRATNNGEPSGGIGVFASSQSQSWDPPMDAEDEIVDILIETYADNIRTTYGALCFEGTMHMMDEYGTSCYDETDAWIVFGDPSLQVRTDTPSTMTVTHDPLIPIGATEFLVEVPGVENALCAVSEDGELLGYGYTDANGDATVTFFEPMEFSEGVDFYVTAYNMHPYHDSVMVGSSYPPDIPTLSGPVAGCRNKEYDFTAQTTDPEGDQIYYMFDWGDNTDSGWLGPVNSGEPMTVAHSWPNLGEYNVTVRAKDTEGSMSRWCDPQTMYIDVPLLDLSTLSSKVVKVETTVRNNGVAEADNVQWNIVLDGGFVLLGRETSGTIDTIPAGGRVDIQTGLIVGFGPTRVIATVETPESTDTRSQGANIFFFIVKVKPGGG